MIVYYITVFLIFVFCALAQQYEWKDRQLDSVGRYRHSQMATFYYVLVASVLVLVAGLRYEVGTDFKNYYLYFSQYAAEFFEHMKTLDEPGFRFICWLVVKVGGNGATVIFVSAMITIGLFLRTIYRNTDRLLMATMLFVFLGCWHGCFNGIRQYLAAAIVFCGIRYLKQREFKKYCLVVFIAVLFHSSAILMLFAYFVVHNKVNIRNIVLMVLGSLAILFSFERVMSLTSYLLDEEFSESYSYLTQSVNTLRVLVAIVPAVFFLVMYWKKTLNEEQRCWMNFLIFNAIMMLATSNSTYLARMGIYTAPFLSLAIPELIKGFNYKNRKVVNLIIPLAYALFWWYEVSNSGTLNSFRFIWQK